MCSDSAAIDGMQQRTAACIDCGRLVAGAYLVGVDALGLLRGWRHLRVVLVLRQTDSALCATAVCRQVMKESKGRANPAELNKLLMQRLNKV